MLINGPELEVTEAFVSRISACFYGENDNRILPMDLKSCNKNKAIAMSIFVLLLFYNDRKSQNVKSKFSFQVTATEKVLLLNRKKN